MNVVRGAVAFGLGALAALAACSSFEADVTPADAGADAGATGSGPDASDARPADGGNLEAGPTAPTLLAHWGFDAPVGNAFYDDSNKHPLAIVGNVSSADGTVSFGAAPAYLQTDGSDFQFDQAKPFTIEIVAMRNDESLPGFGQLLTRATRLTNVGTTTGYMLYVVREDGSFAFERDSVAAEQVASANGSFTLGNRHHLAAVFDGANLVVYVDGAKSATKGSIGMTPPIVANLVVGADSTDETRQFHGVVDDLAIYGGALSDADVLAHAKHFP